MALFGITGLSRDGRRVRVVLVAAALVWVAGAGSWLTRSARTDTGRSTTTIWRLPRRTPSSTRSSETAASVDVIVVGPVRFPAEQAPAYDAFERSPYLADFPWVRHFGAVTVYRRTAPPDSSA